MVQIMLFWWAKKDDSLQDKAQLAEKRDFFLFAVLRLVLTWEQGSHEINNIFVF